MSKDNKKKEGRFKDEDYILIAGWMMNRLNLKKSELMIYALIYGFTKSGENWFTGSLAYMADAISVTTQTVLNQLDSLLKKGAIIKSYEEVRGMDLPRYKVCFEYIDIKLKNREPIKKLERTTQKTLYNKTIDNSIYKEKKTDEFKQPLKDLDYNSREYKIGFNKVEFRRRLLELGADEMHVNDWFKYRDSKKSSTYSHTAFSRFINECEKFDCSVAFAVEECASKEWIGFEGRWSKLEQKPQRDIIKELQADKDRFESFFNADLDLRRWSVRASKSEKFKFIEELNKHFINDSNKRYNHTYSKALEFALEYVKNK